jgi:hypothetical protein
MAGTAPILSLDVFDTLLTRVYARSVDVFPAVAQALADAGLLVGTPSAWVARRVAAEAELWRNAPGAASLAAIYAVLGAQAGWSEEQNSRARAIEIEVEGATHVPVPVLRRRIEAWRRSGGQVIFVSDMYLPAVAVRRSLERHRWIEPADKLFVSSECRATKASGRLFGMVMNATGAGARSITHIGDNRRADVVAPLRLGMHAEHFTAAALNRYERRAATAPGAAAQAASLYAGCMRLARLEAHASAHGAETSAREAAIWRAGAGVAGPVLTAFTLWVLGRAAALGIRRLYFLARDGQILHRIAGTLQAERRHVIELRYLHASRQAWHPAAVVELDDSDFDWLFDAAAAAPTLNQVAVRLSIAPELLSAALAGAGAAPVEQDRPLAAAQQGELRIALKSAPLRDVVLARSRELRETVVGYLRQEGLCDGVPYAIIDIGWNGRLQRSLGKILAAAGEPAAGGTCGFYFGLWQKARASSQDRMEAFFHDPDLASSHLRPLCNGPMLEQFTEADHGTTLGYVRAGTRWQPVLKETHNGRALDWGLAIQHGAVLAFARQIDAHFLPRCPAVPGDTLRALCSALLEEFLFSPDRAEADAYGSFEKTGTQEHAEHAELAPRLGTMVALRLGLLGQGRFGRMGDPSVLWLPGTLARSGLPWLNYWVRVRNSLGQRLAA